MTPFGARLRSLRAELGVTQADLADRLQVSAAYLSALEHGRRGSPSTGLVHQICAELGLIWDASEELLALARLSNPRIVVNTAGLSPEQTALANRISHSIAKLPPDAVARIHAILDATPVVPKPRIRRAAGRQAM
jgi:transcriptional regulator with XRE-family HTH domain